MRRALGGVALLTLACGVSSQEERVGESRKSVETSSKGVIFELSSSLSDRRGSDARFREMASRAAGTLFAPLVEAESGAAATASGARLRATCGVTFVSETLAVTAAHCVDPGSTALSQLTVEMYRPSEALATSFQRAATLSGTFPEYQHARLGPADGYFVDRYGCRLLARCSSAFGGPYHCDATEGVGADTALLECDGRPGARYGFVDVAELDQANLEVFMPWAHELYDVPLDPADDRFQHYVRYDGQRAHNYHYFGQNAAQVEQNQLLPLVSSSGAVNLRHTKVTLAADKVVTDLLGCQGSDGAAALQPSSSGAYQLLGPFFSGDNETALYLCDHDPALDSSPRGAGSEGLAYQPLAVTQAMLTQNRSVWLGSCSPLSSGAGTLFTRSACMRQALASDAGNVAFVAALRPKAEPNPLEFGSDWEAFVDAQRPLSLHGFSLEQGALYRVGFRLTGACAAPPCGTLGLAVDGVERVRQSAAADASFAAHFVAQSAGYVPLSLVPHGVAARGVSALVLKREDAVNHLDSELERWQLSLQDLESAFGRRAADALRRRWLRGLRGSLVAARTGAVHARGDRAGASLARPLQHAGRAIRLRLRRRRRQRCAQRRLQRGLRRARRQGLRARPCGVFHRESGRECGRVRRRRARLRPEPRQRQRRHPRRARCVPAR
ncbi:MAG: hypothetical protein QM756_32580 [Polyangiaceae bacterium]